MSIFAQPLRDWLGALDACVRDSRPADFVVIALGFLLSWWIYVPVHELAHAWGCLLAGGEVTRLEIDWMYGASLLARVFPYVTVGSEYAGRLSGFDTRGSDLTYLVTCALPFLLTVVIGVPLLRAVPSLRGWRRSLTLGAAVPVAFAPVVSLTGDYYEMGSILVSRVVAASVPGFPLARWRSDDVVKLTRNLASEADAADVAGVAASLIIGAALALATYWLGVLMSRCFTALRP
jgi:hypothetical protein